MAYISIKEMLAHMAAGEPFQMKVVTYDKKRRKGGELAEYHEAVQVIKRHEAEEQQDKRPLTRVEQMQADLREHHSGDSRNPSHGKHYTRNINVLQEGQPTAIIRKIHPILVIEFNHQKVVP